MSEVLSVSPDVIFTELEAAEALIRKWRERVGEGIPNVDGLPAQDEVFVRFVSELCGELLVVAGKCQTLSAVGPWGRIGRRSTLKWPPASACVASAIPVGNMARR